MSGHSKWSTIKRKKGKADQERGRIFSRLIREITVAARSGGGDVGANVRLRTAVQAAKGANMPADNIDRAIKRGTGELPGVSYEEIFYEGYGPHGVAVLVETLTDNRNRTTSEIRHLFSKHGGNLGEVGCVSWMFDLKGLITVEKSSVDEDKLIGLALDAGAEDVDDQSPEYYEITIEPSKLEAVRDSLKNAGVPLVAAELSRVPQSAVTLGEKESEQILRFMEVLEEHDDTQKVHANFDIPDEIMAKLAR
ncbi:MAG: YebC/PmpR family DNA-binding transcriptional regulator [Candidatus Eiseniibacteriota bacterium]|nr:MAG: YebC/PmpR family DNA-binding transcriptional regulator [Candidatus Eisenbacteria bacterium]